MHYLMKNPDAKKRKRYLQEVSSSVMKMSLMKWCVFPSVLATVFSAPFFATADAGGATTRV